MNSITATGYCRRHGADSGPTRFWHRGLLYHRGPGGNISEHVVVINPNSSERISDQIREAVGGECTVITSTGGPAAIETDDDVSTAVGPMLALAREQKASALVVACFSDPGLERLRSEQSIPAFGIAESAMAAALAAGNRIGVISSVDASVPRHDRYWKRLGIADSVVADVALGLGVLELDTDDALQRALEAGRELLAAGADVIVLGCTGMTHMQGALAGSLGIPVIDPCRAAVDAAVGSLGDRSER